MQHSIEFTRDGRRIVVRSPAGLTIVDVTRKVPPCEVAIPNLHTFAAVGDQLWVVAGTPPTLTVLDANGTWLAEAVVSGKRRTSRLHRAGAARLATWSGAPCTSIAFGGDGLAVTPLPDAAELALAISSTRMLLATRQMLSLLSQNAVQWTIATPGAIVDATLVLDGRAVAIHAQTSTATTVLVIGLRDGAVLHRITAQLDDTVRFAGTRGLALIASPHRLVLVDLRFGRVLVEHHEQREIAAVAIDDGGRDIAIVYADQPESITHVTVAELVAATATPAAPAPVAAAEPAPIVDLPPAPPPTDPFRTEATLACTALPQRLALETATPAEVARLDEHHRDLATAIAGAAIARAWDEGRLAYPHAQDLPYRSEVNGLVSSARGFARVELEAAVHRVEQARAAELETRRAIAPRIGPLDALEHEFGLSPVAREILMLVAAPALWGETARLYGIVANDEGRPLVDEHLIGELLADRTKRGEIARELDDDAPLVRQRIVRVHAGAMRPFLPLVVDPVVLKLLRGAPVDTELQPLTHERVADRTFAALRIPSATKERIAAELARATGPLRVVIRGRVGSGRHALAAAIAAAGARKLGVVDATPLTRDPKRIGELADALARAHLAGLVPCVDGLDVLPSSDVATREHVREILRRHAGPLVVRLPSDAQPPLVPGYAMIDLPALGLGDRLVAWQQVLDARGLTVAELPDLADRYPIGPGIIERVAAGITDADRKEDVGPRLDAAIRQHLEVRLANTADRVRRLATWSQIIVPPDIEDSLTELIARIKHRRTVFDRWGFDRVVSTSRGVTALFQGGPGTGKTLVASAIANELGMDLYRVDLSRVLSKWIGETEQNLAKLFDAAEDGNTIILFDEADSLFAKRTEVKSSVDRYANLEVNYLLQRIDSFEGIAILTTNFGTSIDSAFKRRLSLRLTFPFPDEDMREKLWRAHLPAGVPMAGDFDLAGIARRYQMSGGYIRNVALRAAFLAAEEHTALTQAHLERAIKAEFREIGKIAETGVLE